MKLEGEQVLARVYLRNTDKCGWGSAVDAVLQHARKANMAGATVLRGIMGLHFSGQLLESKSWSLVEHSPLVIELVDDAQDIGRFLASLRNLIPEGLVTLERAHVLVYRHTEKSAERARQHLQVPGPVLEYSTLPSAEEYPIMKLSEEGQLLRILIGESDTWEGKPLYRAIVMKAKELGLAGVTVLHGAMGFGANSRVHAAKLLAISTDLPVVIEIVDDAKKIDALLPFLDQTVQEGLITIEAVRVLKYPANGHKSHRK